MEDGSLTLHEQILLLVLKERDGSLLDATHFRHALAGAVLAELTLRGYVELDDDASEPLVTVVRPERTGDPALDIVLSEIVTAHRRCGLDRWVERFADHEDLHMRVARQLCRKGAMDEHEGRVRLVFRRTVYVDLDPEIERRVTGRVREAVFGDGPLDIRDALLAALAQAGDILTAIFEPEDVLDRLDRLQTLMDEVELDGPQAKALHDAERAIVAATDAAVMQESVAAA